MHRSKAGYIVEVLIHAVFWLGVYYALKGLTASSFQMVVSDHGRIMSQDGKQLFPYAWIVMSFLALVFYTTVFWLFKRAIRFRTVWRVTSVTVWLILLYLLNYLVIGVLDGDMPNTFHHMAAIPPDSPPSLNPSRPFSAADWLVMQPIIALIFILILGVAIAYFFIGDQIKSELARRQSEADQLSTELKFLRGQVNPHFLFNTLNNLFSMAQRDGKDDVADKIAKLSGMMRYMLYDSNADRVPLENEITYLQDCIALHQMRYAGNQVEISFRYPDEAALAPVRLAPMLLIPFLENAFKHGVRTGQRCFIAMEISINQKRLIFICRNADYSDIKRPEAEKGGIGLENVRRRLELVYPGRHNLLAGSENGEYMVNLQIDLA